MDAVSTTVFVLNFDYASYALKTERKNY